MSDYTTGNPDFPYLVVPWDLEKIYNIAPLYSAGISGQGMKIVVLEDTNLYNCNATNSAGNSPGTPCSATSDWAEFRNIFGSGQVHGRQRCARKPGVRQTGANNCTNPGINGDDDEAALDVEWSSAAAPSASIVNAACADPRGGFGGLVALQNILNHPNADNVDVISMSYGESEESSGAALNAAFNTTFQQAVTAGHRHLRLLRRRTCGRRRSEQSQRPHTASPSAAGCRHRTMFPWVVWTSPIPISARTALTGMPPTTCGTVPPSRTSWSSRGMTTAPVYCWRIT